MPLVSITTNVNASESQKAQLASQITQECASVAR